MRTVSLRLTGLLLLAGLAFSVASCETPDVSPKGGKGGCGTPTSTSTSSGTGSTGSGGAS